jgi:hypothetical protein
MSEPNNLVREHKIVSREESAVARELRAARRAAEFALWQASGGDCLRRSLFASKFDWMHLV